MFIHIIYYSYKGILNLEIIYSTYAKDVSEIAIKKPFNLLDTVANRLRSVRSYPPKLPRIASDHIGREANSIERKRQNINILVIMIEIRKAISANKREPFNPIINSSFKLFGKLLLPSK